MAPANRRQPERLKFSKSGSRFDKKRMSVPVRDPSPISATFTRKIIYCKRCRNRVVSNVSHCPYCGKNLLPIYRRFLFWLIMILLFAGAAIAFIFNLPSQQGELSQTGEVTTAAVVGAPEGSAPKDLAVGTTVDYDNVLVTVTNVSHDIQSPQGVVTSVQVQFINKSTESVSLLLTQWLVEDANGNRIDSEPFKATSGETITSDLLSTSLAAGDTYSATLHFVGSSPQRIVFYPNALQYNEEGLVTWIIPASVAEPEPETAATGEEQ